MNISNTTESTLALAFSSNGSFSLNNVTVGASGNMGTAITLNGTTSYSQFTNPLPGANSTRSRPVIPFDPGHPFHAIPATDSRAIRPQFLESSDA